jgi:hypothetical protein
MDVTIQVGPALFSLGGNIADVIILNVRHSVKNKIIPTWIVIPSIIKFIKNSIKVNAPNHIGLFL